MRTILNKILYISIVSSVFASSLPASRIKDLTSVEGARDNQLVGYGLVIGLAGTGDGGTEQTKQAFSNTLKQFGLNVPKEKLSPANVASVMITAEIGPYIKTGSRMDVTVSSTGNASTLQGGILLQTPLYGADGVVYSVAQGPIAVGGFIGGSGGEGGATVQQNHPTVGKIAGGAIVEREIPFQINNHGTLNFLLNNPDYTSAVRLADAINYEYPGSSQALNAGTVNVMLPEKFLGQEPNFIAAIGALHVVPDLTAKVIINERTGTIVATSNVRISTIAVSHGSLTITISNNLDVSQPAPFSDSGTTEVVPSTQTNVTEMRGGFSVVDDFPTIERLTTALNALGVSTREMMSILQAIKSSGALQAELVLN